MDTNIKNKFDNYIFYSICELALSLFKTTKFSTFRGYCISMKNSIVIANPSYSQCNHIAAMVTRLEVLYALPDNECGDYIVRFFCDEKYLTFEQAVFMMDEFYKNSLN